MYSYVNTYRGINYRWGTGYPQCTQDTHEGTRYPWGVTTLKIPTRYTKYPWDTGYPQGTRHAHEVHKIPSEVEIPMNTTKPTSIIL